MKCKTCNKEYNTSCDYNQGRCPNHPPLISKPYPVWLLLLAAPIIIGAWMIMNPCKVWEQAKKDWKL
jgi:hypothetical protein